MNATTFKVGDKVKANGFNGSVVEVCTGDLDGMLIVGLPGGQCCVSASGVAINN